MTPDVVVDIGNTRVKWGRCRDGRVVEMVSLAGEIPEDWSLQVPKWNLGTGLNWAVAAVQPKWQKSFTRWAEARGGRVHAINRSHISIPVEVDEPESVGIDRLLNALAASRRVPANSPAVVISVGTAMTVDHIDAGSIFKGGAILPGPWMMARALHEFTAKLPLVAPRVLEAEQTIGRNTREAIESGIQAAIFGAADVIIWNISRVVEQKLRVFVTGGGMSFVRGIAFSADIDDVEYDDLLTLDGIRIAAEALP